MNTPSPGPGDEDADLRYAEYVLGVLDAGERAAVEREMLSDAHASASVSLWQQRLTALAETTVEARVPAAVWTQILRTIQAPAKAPAARAESGESLWSSLRLWRALAIGASVLAALLLAFVWLQRPTGVASRAGYLASTIRQSNGAAEWTVTMDLQRARLIIVPGSPQAIPQGRAPELWLIPKGARPIALGMIATDRPITLALAGNTLARLAPTAALAVSIEAPTGSPTGQPTGAVIGQGAIRQAPPGAA